MTHDTKGAAQAAPVNRKMTTEELGEYTDAIYGYVFDSAQHKSGLFVAPRIEASSGFVLYGDLRPAFFADDDDDHDNHDVVDLIEDTSGFVSFKDHVRFEAEAATFFAYATDVVTARRFADYVAGFVQARREWTGPLEVEIATSTRSQELAYWRGFAKAIEKMTAEPGNRVRFAETARDAIAKLEAEDAL